MEEPKDQGEKEPAPSSEEEAEEEQDGSEGSEESKESEAQQNQQTGQRQQSSASNRQRQYQPPSYQPQQPSSSPQGQQDGKPDWKKEGFFAGMRREALKPEEQAQPKDKKQTGNGEQQNPEAGKGQEKSDQGETGQQGQEQSQQGAEKKEGAQSGQKSSGSQTGTGSQGGNTQGEGTESGEASGEGSGNTSSQGGSTGKTGQARGNGGTGEPDGEPQGEPTGAPIRTIASRAALAQYLAQQAAAERFRTTDGIKTGAEVARDLASGERKFDFQSEDGSLQVNVRGDKAIAKGPEDEIRQLAKPEAGEGHGKATTGGALAGKGDRGFPTLDVHTLPPHITSILPMLRELSGEAVVERLGEWMNLPSGQKARTGAEYRLIKGFVHVAALKAVAAAEEVEDSHLTASPSGERLDFVTGRHDHLPLDEERTVLEALSQGGVIDDLSEVHEKRVRCDAPHILFVLDGSGSMGYENRAMSCAVAATATAHKYGPMGATFGLIAFTDNPAVVVPMPETEVERVVDGIFSVSPGGGTSYAPALELAFRHATPRTTVVVLGDFLDSGVLSQEALALKSSKEIKVVGIVSSAGNPSYANEVCDETYLVGFDDPTSVALVAVKAAL